MIEAVALILTTVVLRIHWTSRDLTGILISSMAFGWTAAFTLVAFIAGFA